RQVPGRGRRGEPSAATNNTKFSGIASESGMLMRAPVCERQRAVTTRAVFKHKPCIMEHAMASGFSLLRASRPIAATFGWRAAFASQSANEVPYDGSELSLRIHKTLSDSDASTLSR